MIEAKMDAPAGMLKGLAAMHRTKRGEVKGRSRKAQKRLLWVIAESAGAFRDNALFVTLTVGRDGLAWPEAKRRFNVWCMGLRRQCDNVCGIWVAESQKRGAPHFHLLVSPASGLSQKALRLGWLGLVKDTGSTPEALEQHAFDSQWYGVGSEDAAVEKYLAKCMSRELSKRRQQDSEVHTGRTWGVIGKRHLMASSKARNWAFVDRDDLGKWLCARTLKGMEASGMLVGGVAKDVTGEVYRICHASVVDFGTGWKEFAHEFAQSGDRPVGAPARGGDDGC